MTKQNRTIAFILLICLAGTLPAQVISNKTVKRGIDAFYMADFEAAKSLLQEAVIDAPLAGQDLFYAHLYIAFSNIRLERDLDAVRLHFLRAIKVKPGLELDPMKIPPDLYDRFAAVRRETISSIVVITQPTNASAVVIDPETEVVSNKSTPTIFRNLLEGTYQVLISKGGFHTWTRDVQVAAGVSDTLSITLLKKKKSFFAKAWPYGAGAVAAGAVIFAITQPRGESAESPPLKPDLPGPPQRP